MRGEGDEAMPLVAAVLTEAEWRHWDQANNVKGKSLGRLAADGHWLMDGLDPAKYSHDEDWGADTDTKDDDPIEAAWWEQHEQTLRDAADDQRDYAEEAYNAKLMREE